MKKLLFIVPLMAATLSTTGCGQRTRQGLTIAIDSDTIVLPKPQVIEADSTPAVADSDSLSKELLL